MPESVQDVVVLREGNRRVIVPADNVWDDFFNSSGIDIEEPEDPSIEEREAF